MKKTLVIGNWKMHLNTHEASLLVHRLHSHIPVHREVEVVLAPSMLSLQPLSLEVDRRKFKLAAQDEGHAHQACEGCPDGRAPDALAQEDGRKYERDQGCNKTQADGIGERQLGKAPEEGQQYNGNQDGAQNMELEHGALRPGPGSRKPNGA